MADEDQIIVQIEGDTGTTAEGATEKPRNPDGTFKAAEPIDDLAAQFEEQRQETERAKQEAATERQRAAEARQEADRARQDAASARTQVADSEYETVATGLAAAQAEADGAQREYKTAYEAGDPDAMATAQRKMARAEARILRLDESKSELEVRRTKPEDQIRPRTEAPRQADPVDEFLSRCQPKTRDWFAAHRDWAEAAVTNGPKARKLDAAHATALEAGYAAESPEYFDHCETYLGLREQTAPAKTNGNGAAKPAVQTKPRRQSVPVAPVQQSSGGTNGGGDTVSLSRKEADAAVDGTHVWNYDDPSGNKKFKKGDPIGVQEFARRKREMTKQGLYDRTFTDA